ncbi:GIY-YIG nuclease family protein [Patescibacteria group bacterium]|nr:MAG: GIY-YIG nuclease family protein [Patescibacteria group bacterium]
MVMFWVYILQSLKDKRTYTGYTKDLIKRLQQHNAGQVKATKHRKPMKLLFSEQFQTEQQAKNHELWWKSGSGRRELKKFFKT